MDIREVIARRSDLGTFLVHLTRATNGIAARARLEQILNAWELSAVTAYGPAVQQLVTQGLNTASQRSVSFTETPLEHVYWMMRQIDGREMQFAPYGVALPKKQGRVVGINPVWYVDIMPTHDWLMNHVNELVTQAIHDGNFDGTPIANLAPFIEQMGTGVNYRKEFWWEREWRHVGNLHLPAKIMVLCPEEDFAHFGELLEAQGQADRSWSFLDPNWGLEQIVARLAAYSRDEIEML